MCPYRLGIPCLLMGCGAAEHQDRGSSWLLQLLGPSLEDKEVRICTRFPSGKGSFRKGQDLSSQLMMQVPINVFFHCRVHIILRFIFFFKIYSFYLKEKHIKTVKDTGRWLFNMCQELAGCALIS